MLRAIYRVLMQLNYFTGIELFRTMANSVYKAEYAGHEMGNLKRSVQDLGRRARGSRDDRE